MSISPHLWIIMGHVFSSFPKKLVENVTLHILSSCSYSWLVVMNQLRHGIKVAQLGFRDQGQIKHQVPLPARTLLQIGRQTDRYEQIERQMCGWTESFKQRLQFQELSVNQLVVMPFLPISKVMTTSPFLIMAEAATIKFWNISISH